MEIVKEKNRDERKVEVESKEMHIEAKRGGCWGTKLSNIKSLYPLTIAWENEMG